MFIHYQKDNRRDLKNRRRLQSFMRSEEAKENARSLVEVNYLLVLGRMEGLHKSGTLGGIKVALNHIEFNKMMK